MKDRLESAFEDMDELMKNAKPTKLFENVRKATAKRESESLIDEQALRRGQDWSKIGSQVFGAEE